jgi:hypothetical protein
MLSLFACGGLGCTVRFKRWLRNLAQSLAAALVHINRIKNTPQHSLISLSLLLIYILQSFEDNAGPSGT